MDESDKRQNVIALSLSLLAHAIWLAWLDFNKPRPTVELNILVNVYTHAVCNVHIILFHAIYIRNYEFIRYQLNSNEYLS